MAYADFLDKRGALAGYRFRINGCKYYWVSHADVPTLTDSAGGTAYTRVEGAFASIPNPLPLSAHPLQAPAITSTTLELIDVDDALTDVWATERGTPAVVLSGDVTAGDGEFDVVPGGSTDGLGGFAAAGYAYVDNETVEYPANGAATIGVDPGNVLIRGKFAEGFEDADVDHDQYLLATDALARPVYSFLPFLWYRECILEIFDLENLDDYEEIARGFIIEPEWVGDDVFRLKIQNYAYLLQKQVFRHTEVKGRLNEKFSFEADRAIALSGAAAGVNVSITYDLVGPHNSKTEALNLKVDGTNDIAPATAFITSGNMPSTDPRWMPTAQMFVLVGGDDGEIVGVTDYSYASTTGIGTLTVNARGCFGTPIGDEGSGSWPEDTTVQFLCALAGNFPFQRLSITNYDIKTIASWRDNLTLDRIPGFAGGVNAIDAFLMLLCSTDDNSNLRGGGANEYDVLPPHYGLGVPVAQIDFDEFESFQTNYVNNRDHVYIAKEPTDLLSLVLADIQNLYGGMIYAKTDGTITIKQMRKSVPSDTITTIAEADIVSLETIGVRDVFNAFKFVFDQWPSESETTVMAYDYRRRDALGESPAPDIVSNSLRGDGFRGRWKFNGENDVRNKATEYLQLLGNGAPNIVLHTLQKHNNLEPGDFVKFTHNGPPQIIANARGFDEQLAIVIEAKANDAEAYMMLRLMLLKEEKTCLWGPSAEILARTSDTVFTIKASTFSADDRSTDYWDAGGLIIVWDANMQNPSQEEISTFVSPTITLVAPGTANVQNAVRITWDDWDSVRAGASTAQIARLVTAEWYGYLCDANDGLGATPDAARIYL